MLSDFDLAPLASPAERLQTALASEQQRALLRRSAQMAAEAQARAAAMLEAAKQEGERLHQEGEKLRTDLGTVRAARTR